MSWYEIIKDSKSITQGDILKDCALPQLSPALFHAQLKNSQETEDPAEILEFMEADVIILSQACEIEHDKIDSIIVCPIWPFSELKDQFKASNLRDSLRQGKEPAFHLINKHSTEEINLPYSVVEFRNIYTLPKSYLEAVAEGMSERLRMLSPYREHLAQSFARFFMRVGLPLDIPRNFNNEESPE